MAASQLLVASEHSFQLGVIKATNARADLDLSAQETHLERSKGAAQLPHVSDFHAGLQGDGGSFRVRQPDDLAALVALQPSVQGLLEAGPRARAVGGLHGCARLRALARRCGGAHPFGRGADRAEGVLAVDSAGLRQELCKHKPRRSAASTSDVSSTETTTNHMLP